MSIRVNPDHFDRLAGVYSERLDELEHTNPGYRETFTRFSQHVCEPGQLVVALPYADEDLDAYITHGQGFAPGTRAVPGEHNACHENAARLWLTGQADGIVTGYALSCDGLWRQHSAAVDAAGTIIETTTMREAYHMARFSTAGAWMFAVGEVGASRAAQLAGEERLCDINTTEAERWDAALSPGQ